ncbi:MAG: hypothetical protein ACXWNK_03510 [Vulcanimicrobiaceae bacterium]
MQHRRHRSQCTLDTGARNSITLTSPFMAAHPDARPGTPASQAGII